MIARLAWRGAAAAAGLLAPIALQAAPALGPAYGDNMVLQQGQPIPLSGKAAPGAVVTARLGTAEARTRADAAGDFTLTLPAQSASARPMTLTLSDPSGAAQFTNILIGNVFLCSGQSNMELPVVRALDAETQLRRAGDDGMRLAMIANSTAPLPQSRFAEPVIWQAASPQSAAQFSAACFFMAKQLRRDAPAVPIGLIHSNWGGSAANVWLDPAGVEALHGQDALDLLALHARDPLAATRAFAPRWMEWWRAQDAGREPWRHSAVLDWQAIPQFSFWNQWRGTGLDAKPVANVWLRQTLRLTAGQAEGGGTLAIGAIDDLDMTFVNGAPVGYTFGWGVERHYRVPAALLREGDNEILIAANNAWDQGGFFAGPERLYFTAADGTRVGLGADWQFARAPFDDVPPRAPWDSNAGLGVMHNAMIAPLGPMRLAGVVWYQGESDVGAGDYAPKLQALIAGWRRQFGAETRVLVVQLAGFGERRSAPAESGWAQLRDEQRRAVAADRNAVLVSAIDLGEPSDIHPANKNDLGLRLAKAFVRRAMPMPQMAQRQEEQVIVTFAGLAGDLAVQGGPYPLGVELCGGSPGTCRYALAQAAGARLRIAIPHGMKPTRVRYGWADAPILNLYDAANMPLPGFELMIAP